MVRNEYQYSVKADVSAKGFVQTSIHVYSDDLDEAITKAATGLHNLNDYLKIQGFRVATDIDERELSHQAS